MHAPTGLCFLACAAMLAAQDLIGFDPGRPPSPPLISLSGHIKGETTAEDPSIPPKGSVARIVLEEIHGDVRGQRQPPRVRQIVIEYDEQRREVTKTEGNRANQTKTIT